MGIQNPMAVSLIFAPERGEPSHPMLAQVPVNRHKHAILEENDLRDKEKFLSDEIRVLERKAEMPRVSTDTLLCGSGGEKLQETIKTSKEKQKRFREEIDRLNKKRKEMEGHSGCAHRAAGRFHTE